MLKFMMSLECNKEVERLISMFLFFYISFAYVLPNEMKI